MPEKIVISNYDLPARERWRETLKIDPNSLPPDERELVASAPPAADRPSSATLWLAVAAAGLTIAVLVVALSAIVAMFGLGPSAQPTSPANSGSAGPSPTPVQRSTSAPSVERRPQRSQPGGERRDVDRRDARSTAPED